MLKIINKSIRVKMVLLLLTAIVIPIVISSFITYKYTTESVKKGEVEKNIQLFQEGEKNITTYFDSVNKASTMMYDVGSDRNNWIYFFKISNKSYVIEQDVHRLLHRISASVDGMYQVNLYVNKTKYSYLFKNYSLGKKELNDDFYKSIMEVDKFIEPTHISSNYNVNHIFDNKKKEVVSFHRKITDIPKEDVLGYISIDIELEKIEELCKGLYDSSAEEIYIFDKKNNRVIYNSINKDVGQNIKEDWYYKILTNKEYTNNIEVGENIITYINTKNDYMDWIIAKKIPLNYLYRDAKEIARKNLFIGAVLALVIMSISIFISYHFTKPIKELIEYIEVIKKGDFNVNIKVNRKDEFGILTKHFKNMIETINDYIINEYKLEIINKSNELKVLQAQINPHFLNNTLQAIGTEALKRGNKTVYVLLSKLGGMMSYSMNTETTLVKFSDELNYSISYLELQKNRFGEYLEYKIDIEEETKNFFVPKMIIQPIIENSFKHGFRDTLTKGKITITARIVNKKTLKIEIEDNGSGISDEKLKKLKQNLYNDKITGQNIGLNNCYKRLKFYFKQQGKLELDTTEVGGLKVTIIIEYA